MILKMKNASIGYNGKEIVSDINTTMNSGQINLLMGNNGMGKTTLIKTILNQIPLINGELSLDDKPVSNLSNAEIAKNIAVVFSTKKIPANYSTKDLISLGRYIHYPYYFQLTEKDRELVQSIIHQLNLEEFENTSLSKLSDGNLQKAFVGRALVQNTPFIILDEPTSHLDEINKIMLYRTLYSLAKKENKLILFSSHDWRLAKEFCDSIFYIKDKKAQFDSVENILAKNVELNNPLQNIQTIK